MKRLNEMIVGGEEKGRGTVVYSIPDVLQQYPQAAQVIIRTIENTPELLQMIASYDVDASPHNKKTPWSMMWNTLQQAVIQQGITYLPADTWKKIKSYRWSRLLRKSPEAPDDVSNLNSGNSPLNKFDQQYNKTMRYMMDNMPSFQTEYNNHPTYMFTTVVRPPDREK